VSQATGETHTPQSSVSDIPSQAAPPVVPSSEAVSQPTDNEKVANLESIPIAELVVVDEPQITSVAKAEPLDIAVNAKAATEANNSNQKIESAQSPTSIAELVANEATREGLLVAAIETPPPNVSQISSTTKTSAIPQDGSKEERVTTDTEEKPPRSDEDAPQTSDFPIDFPIDPGERKPRRTLHYVGVSATAAVLAVAGIWLTTGKNEQAKGGNKPEENRSTAIAEQTLVAAPAVPSSVAPPPVPVSQTTSSASEAAGAVPAAPSMPAPVANPAPVKITGTPLPTQTTTAPPTERKPQAAKEKRSAGKVAIEPRAEAPLNVGKVDGGHPLPEKANQQEPVWQRELSAELEVCGKQGFFERLACTEKARWKYCSPNRWNTVKECALNK
jgi:hypothetical protein